MASFGGTLSIRCYTMCELSRGDMGWCQARGSIETIAGPTMPAGPTAPSGDERHKLH